MQINLHISIESSQVARWAASNLTLTGLGWDVPTPEAIESLMCTNEAFCSRIVSLYVATHGATSPAPPLKKKRL